MSDDVVKIEVDGKEVEAKKGQMLIEVTDAQGTYIPRFCYHEKLSVAANCRMCLVEVEKAPKPLPACATPVMDGMKVFTRSPAAVAAQKATMEFLLINHPLDCPICDQGGECELQDLALGYGRDVSRYTEKKRVVKDKDIGPLVSTDMTRCIHCTRCVRFSQEIEGLQELGTIGRAEDMQISMYVEKAVDHELSANIIDLCPVGALNNKPYRYSARAWEMTQKATVSAHDCAGTNLYAHVLRGTIKRIVPRENEAINETWIADRDRFSYEGVYSTDRLLSPRAKYGGTWEEISWESALEQLAEKLKNAAPGKIGLLSAPTATCEEFHLLARIAEHLGTPNIDHRLRRRDFSDQVHDPVFPWLGRDIASIEKAGAILVAGSNLRKEVPIIAHRVRKAALEGANVSFANRETYEYHFDVDTYLSGTGLVELLAGIAVAAAGKGAIPGAAAKLCEGIQPSDEQKRIAATLAEADDAMVLTGLIAARHPAGSAVRALAAAIGEMTGATVGTLSDGPNTAGGHIAGALPHRGVAGASRDAAGMHAAEMLVADMDALLLVNAEPDADLSVLDHCTDKLEKQKFVAALTPFVSPALEEAADLLLPIGTFAETSGTYVNVEGRWQSFPGISNPIGEARPCWKVLRVLGNLIDVPDFDYLSSEAVRDELVAAVGEVKPDPVRANGANVGSKDGKDADVDVPIYEVDPVVRRATALQLTPEAQRGRERRS